MLKTLLLSLLFCLFGPALAIYKCEVNGKTTYGDEPCREGKALALPINSAPLTPDAADAKQRVERDKSELGRLRNERLKEELIAKKEQQKIAQASAVSRKKCASLALQKKWSEEDAAAASGKSAEKARRNARRKAEKYEVECGK